MNQSVTFKSMVVGAALFSSLHLAWLVLVYIGMAQVVMDFIFKIHMLNSPLQVQQFEWLYAFLLIAVTFSVGAIYGWLYSVIKKSVPRSKG
jgi:cytochrome b subunit of formate dehydrogenase